MAVCEIEVPIEWDYLILCPPNEDAELVRGNNLYSTDSGRRVILFGFQTSVAAPARLTTICRVCNPYALLDARQLQVEAR